MKVKITCECGKHQWINPASLMAKRNKHERKRGEKGQFVKKL